MKVFTAKANTNPWIILKLSNENNQEYIFTPYNVCGKSNFTLEKFSILSRIGNFFFNRASGQMQSPCITLA